jgi:hypothetical protein
MRNDKNKDVIVAVDLYITRSGRVAFMESVDGGGPDGKAFFGYVLQRSIGKVVQRPLRWLPCGKCVSSNDDGDHIVRRA